MRAFDIAVDLLFSDINLINVAIYMPVHGASKDVTIITHKPDEFISIGDSLVVTSTLRIEVRVKDCPVLAVGDKFLIADKAYTVQGSPKLDNNNLIWRVDLV